MTEHDGAPTGGHDAPRFLLRSKLRVPPPPALVTRRHRQLLEGLVGWEGVVCLTAPTGFGKAPLLAAWAAEEQRPVAWLGMDGADGHAPRFMSYLVEALAPVLPAEATAMLRGALNGSVDRVTDAVVPYLLNTLERAGTSVLVVLDGTDHLGPDASAWPAVRQLVGYRPDHVCLALSGREPPPFGLARARAAGRVIDVDEHLLALDDDDLDDLLGELVPDCSDPVRRAVVAAADGWPAPAVLAARIATERGLDDPDDVADVLAVEGRELLAEEGVARLGEDDAGALGALALLPVLDVELASCVLPPGEAVDTLDRLRRRGLLEVMDEGLVWRIWRPLLRVLVDRGVARTADPALGAGLRRAAEILAARDDVASAVRVLTVAGAIDELVELVAARWGEAFDRGLLNPVDEWLHTIGDERVRRDARLLLVRANVAIARRDAEGAEAALAAIEEAEPLEPTDGSGTLAGSVAYLRAHVSLRFRGDGPTAVVEATRAHEEPWGNTMYALATDVLLAAALGSNGRDADAAAIVRAGLRREGGQGTVTWAGIRAYAAIAAANAPDPDPQLTAQHAATAWRTAVAIGASEWTNGAVFRLANAYARLLEGDLDAAEAEVTAGQRLVARGLDRSSEMMVQHVRILIAIAADDMETARDRVQGAIVRFGSWVNPGADMERYRRLAVRVGLADQRLPQALTDRELDVLRALPRAETRADVAASLHVSVDTVKTHLSSAYRKLGVAGRGEAILEGRRLGLL